MQYLETFKKVFGHDSFREGQESVINALMEGRDVLAIMPTGAGKSACYQLPAVMKAGITLVISPLISLMKDQVMSLKACGIAAAYINSSLTPSQQTEALRRASLGAYRIIYVAPERLETAQFMNFAQNAAIVQIAVDEAHCVSQWGQDFRPSYLRICRFIEALPKRPVVAAFTATATEPVKNDMIRLIGLQNPSITVTGYDRNNLYFSVVKPTNKYVYLSDFLQSRREECGIVYCSTRKNVEEVCGKLRMEGFSVSRYHAGLSDEERKQNQDDFRFDRIRIMVATNAFGMGIDKPDVRFVVHYNMPASMESYYQEAGRAGRDGLEARCVLLYSPQDVVLGKWMIEHEEPNPEMTPQEQQQAQALRKERLKKMTFYATSRRCLRGEILAYFGEKGYPRQCNHCSVCLKEDVLVDTGNSRPLSSADQKEVRKAEKQAETRKPAEKPAARNQENLTAYERSLYESLKTLRLLIANHLKVPAFVVLSNAALLDMISRMPKNQAEFLQVSGIGEVKCRDYCICFLAILRDGKEANAAFEVYLDSRRSPSKPT